MNCKQCEKEYLSLPKEDRGKFLFQKGFNEIAPSKCDFSNCPIFEREMASYSELCQTVDKALEQANEQDRITHKVIEKILK